MTDTATDPTTEEARVSRWRGALFVVVFLALIAAVTIGAFRPDPPNTTTIEGFGSSPPEDMILVIVDSDRPLAEGLGTKVIVLTDTLRCPDGEVRDPDDALADQPVKVDLAPFGSAPASLLPTMAGQVTFESC